MSRPLRIEYPDAWYHVMNRGRRGERVFIENQDYRRFVDLLTETVEMWHVRIAAYCLMPNQYHILIQTPDANISRCMRHIDGVYTQRFNRFHHCDGSLFRGRYKSILVDADRYLLQLVRYIHRNPLRAGSTDRIDKYPWSSHQGYLSKAKKWHWLYKDFVLSMFEIEPKASLKRYRQFVSREDSVEIRLLFTQKRWPSIFGSEQFVAWIRDRFPSQKMDEEMTQAKKGAPDADRIKQAVCKYYHVKTADLMLSKRGVFNEPRNVAIYLSRRLRSDTLNQIAELFHMNKYSSVSSVVERAKAMMGKDRKFRKRVEELITLLSQSQGQA